MRIELEGTTFCVAGRFKNNARKERIQARLEEGGGRVLKSMGQRVQVLVYGAGHYVELEQAQERGLPVLHRRELQALLREGFVEVDFEPPSMPAGARPLDLLFGNVRSLLAKPPDGDTWDLLTLYLDQCDPGHVGDLADYIHGHTERWPTPALRSCVAPRGWTRAMLRGETSPAARAVRRVDLHGADAGLRGIKKLLECEDLRHITSLDLSTRKKPPKAALTVLAKSAHMPRLEELVLGPLDAGAAAGLDAGHPATNLTTLGLSRTGSQRFDPERLAELFATRACSRVTHLTLFLETTQGFDLSATFEALADDEILPAFSHLELDYVRHTPHSDAAPHYDVAFLKWSLRSISSWTRDRVRTLTLRTHVDGFEPLGEPFKATTFRNLRELRLFDAGHHRSPNVTADDFDRVFEVDAMRMPSSLERIVTNAPIDQGSFARVAKKRRHVKVVQDPHEAPFIT